MMRILIFLLILTVSCTSHKKTYDDHVIAGSCESEFNQSKLSKGQALWSNISEAGGTTASYMVTGLGYSTDFLITFTGGVAASIVICSPFLAADIYANKQSGVGSFSAHCLGDVGSEVLKHLNPELGPSVKKGTDTWRCPDIDSIAEGLIDVSDCYKAKGEEKLAKEQLTKIQDSTVFVRCLSPEFKQKISDHLSNLK